jgi:hypothetical protein
MRPVARVMLGFALGRAVFGALFLVSLAQHWATAWYMPVERRWVFATRVQGIGMDWYGRSGLSLGGGLIAGLVAWALGGHPRLAVWLGRPSVVVGIARLGGTMLLFDVMFYTLTLLTRDIDPIALPAWYCPR